MRIAAGSPMWLTTTSGSPSLSKSPQETAGNKVAIQHALLLIEVGDEKIEVSVEVVVGACHSHPRHGRTRTRERNAAAERGLLEAEPPVVHEQKVLRRVVGDEDVRP